jgi:peroxiredoxin
LRRWEELRPELDARGIQIVTICTDPPEKIRQGHSKHRLKAVMLSDPALAVTDRYGLRNQAVQSGPPGRPQPVPTSILADAEGLIRWIDQSADYQRRSDPEVVLGALRAHLGEAGRDPGAEPVG